MDKSNLCRREKCVTRDYNIKNKRKITLDKITVLTLRDQYVNFHVHGYFQIKISPKHKLHEPIFTHRPYALAQILNKKIYIILEIS